MGHVRLGSLPRSRAWKEVVGLITAGADVSQIANATIRAADKAFTFVLNDEGFTEAVWLMTQLAIAAKKENLGEHLQSLGVNLPQDTSLPDLAAAVSEALDNKLESNGGRSDLGEMFVVAVGNRRLVRLVFASRAARRRRAEQKRETQQFEE